MWVKNDCLAGGEGCLGVAVRRSNLVADGARIVWAVKLTCLLGCCNVA